MRIITEHDFCAAHRLPRHQGACAQLHGYHYRFELQVDGPVDPELGLVLDFEELDILVREQVLLLLDHADLNEVQDNPTAENIVRWIWECLRPELPGLCEVRLWETPRCSVVYTGS